jgi:hypothetical protein
LIEIVAMHLAWTAVLFHLKVQITQILPNRVTVLKIVTFGELTQWSSSASFSCPDQNWSWLHKYAIRHTTLVQRRVCLSICSLWRLPQ